MITTEYSCMGVGSRTLDKCACIYKQHNYVSATVVVELPTHLISRRQDSWLYRVTVEKNQDRCSPKHDIHLGSAYSEQ